MKVSCFNSDNFDSTGQVGHLNFILFCVIFSTECCETTCPHFSSIGGFVGSVTSRVTGQTKKEWNLNSFPISISIGISFAIVSDWRAFIKLISTSRYSVILNQLRKGQAPGCEYGFKFRSV